MSLVWTTNPPKERGIIFVGLNDAVYVGTRLTILGTFMGLILTRAEAATGYFR